MLVMLDEQEEGVDMCQTQIHRSRKSNVVRSVDPFKVMKGILLAIAVLFLLTQLFEWDMQRGQLAMTSFDPKLVGDTTKSSRTTTRTTTTPVESNNRDDHDDGRFQCYSLKNDLSVAFENGKIEQTFILMPAKASGTSLKAFAGTCMGDPEEEHHPDNFMDSQNRGILPFFHSTLEPPPLVASHLSHQEGMIDLIRHATTKTLIIYIYRDETERMMSAIAYVLKNRLCKPENIGGGPENFFRKAYEEANIEVTEGKKKKKDGKGSNTRCSVPERPFLENFVKNRYTEIGFSVDEHLSCGVWDEIDETAPPHLLFVHYSQSDLLQEQLAKHYCPNTTTPMRENVSTEKGDMDIFLKTPGGKEYEISEWLAAKRNTLEYAYKLSKGTCKHERRSLESKMEQCPDQTLQAFRTKHHYL
mmetsp:Transcript_50272/g.75069  ORF Transcript_50272/g.75069 Transcript_50272/m.75069 type:complete len:415 (-) Transcript_50272:91-1335(-)